MITKPWHSTLSPIATLVIGLVLVSACGAGATGTTAPTVTATNPVQPPDNGTPFASAVISSPAQTGGPVMGHVGDALTFYTYGGHNEVDATLVKIFDPAVPADDTASLPAGAHWVGVEVTLDNHSSDYMNEGSQVDAIASDGTTLTTDDVYQGFSRILDKFQGCAQTDGSEQDVQPYTHCETFVVPDGETITQVGVKAGELSTFGLLPTDQAIWAIP